MKVQSDELKTNNILHFINCFGSISSWFYRILVEFWYPLSRVFDLADSNSTLFISIWYHFLRGFGSFSKFLYIYFRNKILIFRLIEIIITISESTTNFIFFSPDTFSSKFIFKLVIIMNRVLVLTRFHLLLQPRNFTLALFNTTQSAATETIQCRQLVDNILVDNSRQTIGLFLLKWSF